MKFDESKVFTLLNADKVKIRDKGYFADNLSVLKNAVLTEDRELFGEITRILADVAPCRFGIKDDESGYGEYGLFYLVEEPKEEKLRPYRDTEELKQDFSKRYNSYTGWNEKVNPMYSPLIWVKSKRTGYQRLITTYSKDIIQLGSLSTCLQDLFEDFVYLDGTSCGIKED